MFPIYSKFLVKHFWVPLAFALTFSPITAVGQESGAPALPPADSVNSSGPSAVPVAQALVPEGYFATQLAEALKLGRPQDDAEAETLLSNAGIEPKNGWIADYPMTPSVVGEIEKSVAAVAEASKLGMGKEQALKLTTEVESKLGLDVTPASATTPGRSVIYKYLDKNGQAHYSNDYDSIPPEYKDKATVVGEAVNLPPPFDEGEVAPGSSYPMNYNPDTINQYYYSEGPPAITYYPPPQAYGYLYSWVPYSFWSSGLYFGGYFILRDFHRHVFFGQRPWLLSNHFPGGSANFLRGPGSNTPASRPLSSLQRFNSPTVRAGARAILGLSQNRFDSAFPSAGLGANSQLGSSTPRGGIPSTPAYGGREFQPSTNMAGHAWARGFAPRSGFPSAPAFGGRVFQPSPAQHRFFAPSAPRAYYPPAFSQGRGGFAPSFSGGAQHFGGHPSGSFGGGFVGGFHGGGGFGEHGGGGRR